MVCSVDRCGFDEVSIGIVKLSRSIGTSKRLMISSVEKRPLRLMIFRAVRPSESMSRAVAPGHGRKDPVLITVVDPIFVISGLCVWPMTMNRGGLWNLSLPASILESLAPELVAKPASEIFGFFPRLSDRSL